MPKIVLIGSMLSGKTTIGKLLAQSLNYQFKDSDNLIEQKLNMSVADIFSSHSEEYFRQQEEKTISLLLKSKDKLVIATGGGAILSAQTRERLKKHSISIYLTADIDYLVQRALACAIERPLLNQKLNQNKNLKNTIQNILEARRSLYEETANFTVSTNSNDINAIINNIISLIDTKNA